MKTKQLKAALLKQRRLLKKKLKAVQKQKKYLTKDKELLEYTIASLEYAGDHFKGNNWQIKLEAKENLVPEVADGIWIVSKIQKTDVKLTKFYDLVQDKNPPFTMELEGILQESL